MMGKSKFLILSAMALFGAIGLTGYLKKGPKPIADSEVVSVVQEVIIPETTIKPQPPTAPVAKTPIVPPPTPAKEIPVPSAEVATTVDRIPLLFALDGSKLPFVETISYTSRVPWLKGRPAWISDYASHYETSRHFIARGLNKKADYFSQKVGPGDRFNVFKKDKNIRFHLVIDLSQNIMHFYCIDQDANEKILLKTYQVGSGRIDAQKASGLLTPLGKYELGDRIAIYKPGTTGFFQDKKTEMIRVFGTRWIPFSKEVEGCSEPAKGFGIHGAPWVLDNATGQLLEDRSKIGKYDSDGCIRLAQEDMEELFAIIVTKPTIVELVQNFSEASFTEAIK